MMNPYQPNGYPYQPNGYPFPQPPMTAKPKWCLHSYDRIFALLSLPAGFLFVRYILVYADGLHTTVMFLLLHLAGSIYIRKTGSRPQLTHRIIGACIFVFSLSFPLTASPLLHGLCAVFLMLAMIWRIHSICGGLPAVTKYFPLDLGESVLSDPFRYYSAGPQAVSGPGRKSAAANAVKTALIGLVIMIPLTFVIAGLLASADSGMEEMLSSAFERIFERFGKGFHITVLELAAGIPVGLYMFAVLYSASQRRFRARHDSAYYEAKISGARQIPLLAVCAGLTPMCLLYLMFIASQITFYLSAFAGELPAGMTFAESARRGFFELCAAAVINLLVLLGMNCLTKRNSAKRPVVLTVYSVFFCIVTLFVIAAALAKMVLYIDAYGLTQNRLYASWFMVLLALVFAVLLLKQFRPNIPAAVILTAGFTAMLAGLCFARPDARIAEYNIARFEQGTLEQLDVFMLCDLSEDAYTVMLNHPETLKAAGHWDYVLDCAEDREWEIRHSSGRSANLPAQILLQQLHTDTGHGLLLKDRS